MNNELLNFIVLGIAILGVIVALITGITSYRNIKKADKKGAFKEYLQQPLVNSDSSIEEAIKYLRIVNTSWDEKNDNE